MLAAVCVVASFAAAQPPANDVGALLKTFRDEFVEIVPGKGKFPSEFPMGDDRVVVKLDKPFFIAKYEIPQNLYQAVTGENPSRWKGPRNSAEMFDWNEAVAFCKKATAMMRERKLIDADQEIRLPTEAEWEYCCRAGTDTAYSFGDDENMLGDFGWYKGNAAGNDPPVGAKKPNPWGLYDVHGYLWEWCGDAPKDAPQSRVLRGGAWTSTARECRSAGRRLVPIDTKGPDVGFRCVLALTQAEE